MDFCDLKQCWKNFLAPVKNVEKNPWKATHGTPRLVTSTPAPSSPSDARKLGNNLSGRGQTTMRPAFDTPKSIKAATAPQPCAVQICKLVPQPDSKKLKKKKAKRTQSTSQGLPAPLPVMKKRTMSCVNQMKQQISRNRSRRQAAGLMRPKQLGQIAEIPKDNLHGAGFYHYTDPHQYMVDYLAGQSYTQCNNDWESEREEYISEYLEDLDERLLEEGTIGNLASFTAFELQKLSLCLNSVSLASSVKKHQAVTAAPSKAPPIPAQKPPVKCKRMRSVCVPSSSYKLGADAPVELNNGEVAITSECIKLCNVKPLLRHANKKAFHRRHGKTSSHLEDICEDTVLPSSTDISNSCPEKERPKSSAQPKSPEGSIKPKTDASYGRSLSLDSGLPVLAAQNTLKKKNLAFPGPPLLHQEQTKLPPLPHVSRKEAHIMCKDWNVKGKVPDCDDLQLSGKGMLPKVPQTSAAALLGGVLSQTAKPTNHQTLANDPHIGSYRLAGKPKLKKGPLPSVIGNAWAPVKLREIRAEKMISRTLGAIKSPTASRAYYPGCNMRRQFSLNALEDAKKTLEDAKESLCVRGKVVKAPKKKVNANDRPASNSSGEQYNNHPASSACSQRAESSLAKSGDDNHSSVRGDSRDSLKVNVHIFHNATQSASPSRSSEGKSVVGDAPFLWKPCV